MAVDIFLKLDGIEGESIDDSHAQEIDILSWSWGMSQSGTMHLGEGGGAGKVNVEDISFTKYIDNASHALMLRCASGEHIPNAKLTVRKAGKVPLEYIIVTFTDCLVSSISTGGSGGEDRLTENISLNFAEVKFEYSKQKKDGSGEAAKEFAWNIPKNVSV
ncbi:Hcp family type VI secretion system effector [Thalassomonas haliotis]|uniref:Type VI secretion system tube protein Hcp n=1 Tax=Thalassomonas haliotis TaxID=485448 RepID=A0ABY7VK64_9GAMM|nr:type VI secretion system tube protein Hcp [Thalassomonas haliotis]WDE14135.1 type VI secretion system tube protein Hcp [Thalassomonas haliotis]